MASESTQVVLHRLLEPIGRCLTAEVAQRLVDLRADPVAQARIDQLADKSTAGALTDEERAEYELYVAAAAVIAILQAKARTFLTTPTAA